VPLLKTAYIPNTLDPRWDELFSIQVCHRASSLKILVQDREHVGFQAVGYCVIPTEELLAGEPMEGWYDIVVGDNNKTHGAIHIMTQYFPLGALAAERGKILADGYFEAKTDNHVRLYMTADTPQLPVFEGVLEPDGRQYETTRCWLDMFTAINNAERFVYVTGWSVFTAIR
jgi:phospholipase D1/2